ncbi:MAG: molybdenum cofactor guanylyltransferase [Acidobacteriaceae bacterium]
MSFEFIEAEGFVLAGGRSTRMGQDKALLRVGRYSLLELALEKLRAVPINAAPRIAGGRSELQSHGVIISDLHPGCGPLSGIEAALAASSHALNIFLPVDMPLLPPGFLTWMLRRAQITGSLATVPRLNGLPQPLCAVYRRQLLNSISAALPAGNYKVMSVVSAAVAQDESIDVFNVENLASIDPSLRDLTPLPLHKWFHNCNTPHDVAEVENALVFTQ